MPSVRTRSYCDFFFSTLAPSSPLSSFLFILDAISVDISKHIPNVLSQPELDEVVEYVFWSQTERNQTNHFDFDRPELVRQVRRQRPSGRSKYSVILARRQLGSSHSRRLQRLPRARILFILMEKVDTTTLEASNFIPE